MARSLNQCNFIGNLGQDPEIRLTQSGETIANISLGCSDDYKDKQSGNIIQRTNWVRISAFGNTAEVIKNYCRKGSKLFVTGKQVTRKYQAQDGSDRYSTEIQANNIQLLDSRNDNQQNQQQQQNQPQAPNNQQSRNKHGLLTTTACRMRHSIIRHRRQILTNSILKFPFSEQE